MSGIAKKVRHDQAEDNLAQQHTSSASRATTAWRYFSMPFHVCLSCNKAACTRTPSATHSDINKECVGHAAGRERPAQALPASAWTCWGWRAGQLPPALPAQIQEHPHCDASAPMHGMMSTSHPASPPFPSKAQQMAPPYAPRTSPSVG